MSCSKMMKMDYNKKYERHLPVCLDCGDKIRYGRADKKFCSDACRMKNFNDKMKRSRTVRRRVVGGLMRNYSILESLIRDDVVAIDLIAVSSLGFIPSLMTSYRKCGKHGECRCFDIRYIMTATRIYSISKIENFD